jgi:transposase
MFVKKHKQANGRVILSITHGYKLNGKSKHKTFKTLGYLDELEKQYDNPIDYFKTVAKQMSDEYNDEEKFDLSITNNRNIEDGEFKNLGHFALKKIYDELDLNTFFKEKQKNLKIDYKLSEIFKLLIFNRVISPSSKKNAFENKDNFFDTFNFQQHDIYRSLDYFNKFTRDVIKHNNAKIESIYERNKELAYYDVTNFYYEIAREDDDVYDDTGNFIKKGYRKKGPSKENRRDPISQMGLLMDNNGIPISFNNFSGGESEKLSLLPIIREIKADNNIDRIIVVADRGLNTSDNTFYLAGKNDDKHKKDGYVFGQSIHGASTKFKEWVLKKDDYIKDKLEEKDEDGKQIIFTHKSRVVAREVTLKRDKNGVIKRNSKAITYEKQMVYYSAKYAKKQKADRDKVILKAKDLIANPGRYTKATAKGAAEYINNLAFVKSTGELAEGRNLSLNLEKIKEAEKFDGYYSIVTSERNLSDLEIRNIYKGLWEIEETFYILKSILSIRPIHLSLKEHIDAHGLICFVSLQIFRLLEIKLKKEYTVKEIIDALTNYNCTYLEKNVYAVCDKNNECLEELLKLFDINLTGKEKYIKFQKIKKFFNNSKN